MARFAYDAINRLKSADHESWNGSSWADPNPAYDLSGITYDRSGNLLTLRRYRETGTRIDSLTYAYTAGTNRLSSLTELAGASAETWDAEAGSFTYDANGNVKTSPAPYSVTATTYDHRNLATAVTRAGVTTSYRYNEGGWRITKQVGSGNTEVYIQDGPVTLGVFTLNASGTLVSWYGNVLAGARVVGRQPSVGSRSYYHTDLLGTTRAVVQGAVVVESYDYDPYGMLMPGRTLAGTTKEGFTSKERDAETGLDYFGARYYMGAVGRWTAVDPLAAEFPQWNPYNYVFGNPAVLTDPFGLCPDCFLDFVFLAADLHDIRKNGLSFGRGLALGADIVAAALPFVPAGVGATTRFLARGGGEVVDLARITTGSGSKTAQQIGRLRNAGSGFTGGRTEFLDYARGFAKDAFESGDYVSGTIGSGAQAFKGTIFRRGGDFMVLDNAGVIRSFVPDARPGGIVDEFRKLGGR